MRIAAAALLIVAASPVCRGSDTNGAVRATPSAAELYALFREYRITLGDDNANPASYFSRSVVEDWIGNLLQRRGETYLIDEVDRFRSRLRFAERVHFVYRYRLLPGDASSLNLEMIYRRELTSNPAMLTLSYVSEGGKWRITKIAFEATQAKIGPVEGKPIDEFP